MTEKELQAAAAELEAALTDRLLSAEDDSHTFSNSFGRKMNKAIFRADHPMIRSRWRQAVAALLALVLLGGAVLGISPVVRAAFVGWVKEAYGTAMHYFIPENAITEKPEDIPTDYHLGWVPEGYTLLDILESTATVVYMYVDAEGHLLCFDYIIPQKNASADTYFGVKDHTHKVVSVGELPADLYINNDKSGSNALVWMDKNGTVLFCVMGILEEEVLIKLAENILPGKLELSA